MENEDLKSMISEVRESLKLGKNTTSQEMDKQTETDSTVMEEEKKINNAELEETEDPELEEGASELERRIIRNTSEIKKRMKRNSSESKSRSEQSDEEKKPSGENASELEKRTESDDMELEEKTGSSSLIKEASKVDVELEKRDGDGASELENRNGISADGKGNFPDDTIEKVDETNVPLLVGDSISIEMKGGPEGKPTLHVHAKKRKEADAKKKKSFPPIQQMRRAWSTSSNACSFFLRAVLIIFTTLGWMMCAGGIPFVSIAMIAIGSLYFEDCNVQPNIPLYLVVAGVCGTIQHVIAFWNKYLPEESQGRFKAYRRCYSFIDGAMTSFLFIWFILGCVWVYGVTEVDFQDDYKDEYCHKTLYYFAFWLMNISFIICAFVMVLGLCAILCIAVAPKDEAVV